MVRRLLEGNIYFRPGGYYMKYGMQLPTIIFFFCSDKCHSFKRAFIAKIQRLIPNSVKHLRWSVIWVLVVNYSCKTLHLRCLTGFCILLWNQSLLPEPNYFDIHYQNFWTCPLILTCFHVKLGPTFTKLFFDLLSFTSLLLKTIYSR